MNMRNVWGRGFSLGNIPTGDRRAMLDTLEGGFLELELMQRTLNAASARGVDVSMWQAVRDELRASMQRMADRVDALEAAEDGHAWNTERDRLRAAISQLTTDANDYIRMVDAGSKTSVGIWVGAAVLGAVGTVLLVRWYGKKRRR